MHDRDYEGAAEQDTQLLVQQYEESLRNGLQPFFEHSSFEALIDYYEDNREFDKGLMVADAAMAQYPFSSIFLTRKAQLLSEIREYDEARELLDKAELLDPSEINIFLIRADILVWEGKHRKAIAMVEHAISIADKDEVHELYLELADIYEDWEKYAEVIDCLKICLELDPTNEEALNRMWFCTEITEQYEESIAYHTELIDREPYSHIAWFNLAHAYAGLKLYEKAVEAFEYVMAINEDYEAAYIDCGDVLYKMKNYKEAIELYLSSTKIEKPRKEVFYQIARCYEKLKDHQKARYFLRKATSIDPYFDKAFFRIGENYRREELWGLAAPSYERAVKLSENNLRYMQALADTYIHEERLEDAVDIYSRILEIDNSKAEHWIDLALTYVKQDEIVQALETLDAAEEICPDYADIKYLKSAFYYTFGRRKEAIRSLELALIKDYAGHGRIFDLNSNMEKDEDVQRVIEQYKPR